MDHRRRPGSCKQKFTPEEDLRLRDIVDRWGSKDWVTVAKLMRDRTPRQCRERWTNYLNPAILNAPWTPDEDALLENKHRQFGSNWQVIAGFFPNRSKNNIKNRWNTKATRPSQPPPPSVAIPADNADMRTREPPTKTIFDGIVADPNKDDIVWGEMGTGFF
jgi:hypothetical protein